MALALALVLATVSWVAVVQRPTTIFFVVADQLMDAKASKAELRTRAADPQGWELRDTMRRDALAREVNRQAAMSAPDTAADTAAIDRIGGWHLTSHLKDLMDDSKWEHLSTGQKVFDQRRDAGAVADGDFDYMKGFFSAAGIADVEPLASGTAELALGTAAKNGGAPLVEEKRIDPADGMTYTQAEFISQYGGTEEWDAGYTVPGTMPAGGRAPPVVQAGAERRVDPADGMTYTQAEFISQYGGTEQWDAQQAAADEAEEASTTAAPTETSADRMGTLTSHLKGLMDDTKWEHQSAVAATAASEETSAPAAGRVEVGSAEWMRLHPSWKPKEAAPVVAASQPDQISQPVLDYTRQPDPISRVVPDYTTRPAGTDHWAVPDYTTQPAPIRQLVPDYARQPEHVSQPVPEYRTQPVQTSRPVSAAVLVDDSTNSMRERAHQVAVHLQEVMQGTKAQPATESAAERVKTLAAHLQELMDSPQPATSPLTISTTDDQAIFQSEQSKPGRVQALAAHLQELMDSAEVPTSETVAPTAATPMSLAEKMKTLAARLGSAKMGELAARMHIAALPPVAETAQPVTEEEQIKPAVQVPLLDPNDQITELSKPSSPDRVQTLAEQLQELMDGTASTPAVGPAVGPLAGKVAESPVAGGRGAGGRGAVGFDPDGRRAAHREAVELHKAEVAAEVAAHMAAAGKPIAPAAATGSEGPDPRGVQRLAAQLQELMDGTVQTPAAAVEPIAETVVPAAVQSRQAAPQGKYTAIMHAVQQALVVEESEDMKEAKLKIISAEASGNTARAASLRKALANLEEANAEVARVEQTSMPADGVSVEQGSSDPEAQWLQQRSVGAPRAAVQTARSVEQTRPVLSAEELESLRQDQMDEADELAENEIDWDEIESVAGEADTSEPPREQCVRRPSDIPGLSFC